MLYLASRSTINKGLPLSESSHQCPESQASSAGELCGIEQTDSEDRKSEVIFSAGLLH